MTKASTGVVFAVTVCILGSTAQAVPVKPQLHPETIKALENSSLWVRAKHGIADAADIVKNLGILVGVPVGICSWYHLYEWCDSKDSGGHHHGKE